jgi:hypothetical protein
MSLAVLINKIKPGTSAQVHAEADSGMKNPKDSCLDSHVAPKVAGYWSALAPQEVPGSNAERDDQQDEGWICGGKAQPGDDVTIRASDIESKHDGRRGHKQKQMMCPQSANQTFGWPTRNASSRNLRCGDRH